MDWWSWEWVIGLIASAILLASVAAPLHCGTCGDMADCSQAMVCLAAGVSRLDGDGDGIPCEAICR